MKQNKKLIFSLIVGLFISAVALYFAFKGVPFADLVAYFGAISQIWVLPAFGLVLIAFLLRVVRWKVILGNRYDLSFWEVYHPLMIGFMMNCIIPGRVGELARPAILKKKNNIPFTTVLATVAAERIFDLCSLLVLFVLMSATINIDPSLNHSFAGYTLNKKTLEMAGMLMVKLCIVIVLGIFMVSYEKTRVLIKKIILASPGLVFFVSQGSRDKIRQKICVPIISIVDNVAAGFVMVKSPLKVLLCLLLSFSIWLVCALSYYILTFGTPGIDLTFFEISATMIIVCFAIALPSAPGYWGLWEAGGVFALSLFGVSAKEALGYTLWNHVIQIFPVMVLGMISAVITGVNILQVSHTAQGEEDLHSNKNQPELATEK